MISKEDELHIRQQAAEAYPLEAVWLVTGSGIRQVENIHDEPESHFRLSREDVGPPFLRCGGCFTHPLGGN